MSLFVDNHYNRCSLLESLAIGKPGKALVGQLAGCRIAGPEKGRLCCSELAVELLALKRGGCVAVSWLAGCRIAGPEKGRLICSELTVTSVEQVFPC
jgi:hypothetical protein